MKGYENKALPAIERARDLRSRMNIAEKAGQLNQRLYGFSSFVRQKDAYALTEEFMDELERWGGLGFLYGLYRADPWSARTDETGIRSEDVPRVYNMVQKTVMEASRFHIPVFMSSECPHGHQALDGYLLPVALSMAASFAPDLVEKGFAVCAEQMKSMGVHFALVSMLDVLRDPRWGRSEECFGEDPFLAAKMAEAAVKGFTPHGIMVVAKHLCAQGETTGGINASPASIGKRELLEIHLPAAEAACRAGAKGFMAAYNEIDGIPCHANPWLLRDYLRGQLGFEGIVMADGTALDRLDSLTGSGEASAAIGLAAGVDVSLWDKAYTCIPKAIEKGLLSEDLLDEAVLRVLTMKFEIGLFDRPFIGENCKVFVPTIKTHPESLTLARESVVLLENREKMLPLAKEKYKTIAVIGPAAEDVYQLAGDYTPPIKGGTTLLQGMREMAPAGVKILSLPYSDGADFAPYLALVGECDAVVLALGGSSSRFQGAAFDINGAAIGGSAKMDSGEGVDAAGLELPGNQMALAAEMFATGKPVAAVVIGGRPYAIPEIAEGADALLYSFFPGPFGGRAIAEVLFGICTPAGRLPASLPYSAAALPCYYNHKQGYPANQYHNAPKSALYTFGDGLSYTNFSFSGIVAAADGNTVELTVENTGSTAGAAVPMLFIRWQQGETIPRSEELRAFQKLWLKPGERKRIMLRPDLTRLDLRQRKMQGKAPFTMLLKEGGKEIKRLEIGAKSD